MSTRPNFLCLLTDQQRADHWGGGGNTLIRTPNLDRLAAEGVTFDQAYVANPLCMPARGTLFTGLTPRGHGVRTNGIPLDPRLPTITEALRSAGYRTHGIGKIHLTPFSTPRGAAVENLDPAQFPEAQPMWERGRVQGLPRPYYGLEQVEFAGGHGSWAWGDYMQFLNASHPQGWRLLQPQAGTPPRSGAEQSWQSAVPEELHCSTWIADRTLAFLKEQAGRPQPFFLWCSFPDPHHPYCPPRPWCNRYDPADIPPPARRDGELDDLAPHFRRIYEHRLQLSGRNRPTRMADEQLREITALTYGMISLVDAQVGRILKGLEESGLRDDTVVVFMSDHGDMMGDHWMLNKGPFHFDGLLRIPFVWSCPGRFGKGLRTSALATQLDFAPTVLALAGVPIPEGATPSQPEAPDMSPPWPGRSLVPVLQGNAAPVRDSVVVENDEDYLGLRLRTLVTEEHRLTVYAGQPYGELFDRREDPGQLHNLWDSAAHRSVRRDLEVRLLHALIETDAAVPRRLSHA